MAKVSKGMSRLCAHVLRVDDRFFFVLLQDYLCTTDGAALR